MAVVIVAFFFMEHRIRVGRSARPFEKNMETDRLLLLLLFDKISMRREQCVSDKERERKKQST